MTTWIPDDQGERRRLIRAERRRLRQALNPDEAREKSRRVADKLAQLPVLSRASSIMGYMPFDNEVDVLDLLRAIVAQGRTALLPRLNPANELEAVRLDPDGQWQRNRFGILEPAGEVFPEEQIEAVLVPGLAFDPRGYRLGFGKGYYDRFLAGMEPTVFRCGLCYEFQVVDSVFPTLADVPMHWVVTDHSEILVDADFF